MSNTPGFPPGMTSLQVIHRAFRNKELSLPGISLLELLQVFAFEYLININITYHEKTSKHRKMFYTVIPDIFDFILTEFVVLSLLCLVRCSSSSNKNETSLEADKPDNAHEEKLKTYKKKKFGTWDGSGPAASCHKDLF